MSDPARIALYTSNPALVRAFLDSYHQQAGSGAASAFVIPLVINIHPSMRLRHRIHDLWRLLQRRSKINRTNVVAQFFHHLAYKRVTAKSQLHDPPLVASSGSDTVGIPARGCRVVEATSVNDAAVLEAVSDCDCSHGLIVGSDVFTRSTLERLKIPCVNLHFADPAYVRGMPPVFWEVFGNQDSLSLTAHELVPRLDAGAILEQRKVAIEWFPSLEQTLSATRASATAALVPFLFDFLPRYLEGSIDALESKPGPLRTNPTIGQIRQARGVCAERVASHGKRAG